MINRKIKAKISEPKTNSNYRLDGWGNIVTRINTSDSKIGTYRYQPNCLLPQQLLTEFYTSNGIAQRIVDCVIDDGFRSFIDADPKLIKELLRIKTKKYVKEAASWGRLFGGSLLIAYIDDGRDQTQPLNINAIRKVIKLEVYDRYHVQWLETDLIKDFYSESYGEPELFTIRPPRGMPFQIHRSRCFRFNGEQLPLSMRSNNSYWDVSVIQKVYEELRNYGSVGNAAAEIIQDFIQTIISVNGLQELLGAGKEEEIIKRWNLIDTVRSVSNTVFLDAEGEQYHKHASSVAGLGDLWDRFSETICAATGIPISKLFGRSAKGLNANTQNDLDNWNSIVEAYRQDELQPAMDWIVRILEAQSFWQRSERPLNYEWKFPCLTMPSEKEQQEIRKLTAEADAIYIDRGAIDPIEIFKLRQANGEFHTKIVIEKAMLPTVYEEIEEEKFIDEEFVDKNKKPINEYGVKVIDVSDEDKDNRITSLKQKLYSRIQTHLLSRNYHADVNNIEDMKFKLYSNLLSRTK